MKTVTDTPPKLQADKFRDLARQLEADEDDGRFEKTVRQIAPKELPAPEKPD